MTDPIADMLTQIRNALVVKKAEVVLPYSKFKHKLGEVFVKNGLIEDVSVTARGDVKSLCIKLKYVSGKPTIEGIRRVSKPGQRIYSKADGVKRTQSGYGLSIISTSRGLLTDRQARKENLGGEVICQIW